MLEYTTCKYQLLDHFVIMTKIQPEKTVHFGAITLSANGVLAVESGWTWDGPSGPTWDTDDSMVAAVVHDALYELMREGKLSQDFRASADLELFRQLVAHGMPEFRAWAWYKAVRVFGGEAMKTPMPVFTLVCKGA